MPVFRKRGICKNICRAGKRFEKIFAGKKILLPLPPEKPIV